MVLTLEEPRLGTEATGDDDFLRLRRLLSRAQGFALAFVECNLPLVRDGLIGHLGESLAAAGGRIRVLPLTGADEDLYRAIAGLSPAAGEAVAVTGFERSIPSGTSYPPALRRLNMQRELFRGLPCPVILFLPQYALTRLAREAPDFWAWRSGVFELGVPAAPETLIERDPTEFDLYGYANLSAERKRAHLGVLRRLLAELESGPRGYEAERADLEIRISLLLGLLGEFDGALLHAERAVELARAADSAILEARTLDWLAEILFLRGELDEALRIRQEGSLPIHEELGDVRERAITLGYIAEILATRGELDEALRIHQEEVLPVFDQRDVRSRAITLRRIADIFQDQGELDEALRIHREEVLPLFDQVDDVRSRAITLGKIADIYQLRERLDEALRIRREEELPVFDELGEVRERAITLGKIADILKDRGELDEALRILQEEELPVYEKLGLVRERAVGRANLALLLLRRRDRGDRERAAELLGLALADAERRRLPETAETIRNILVEHELGDEGKER